MKPTWRKAWGTSHRVEAWARLFELAAKKIRQARCPRVTTVVDPRTTIGTENLFRLTLWDWGFEAEIIDKEVRRLRRRVRSWQQQGARA